MRLRVAMSKPAAVSRQAAAGGSAAQRWGRRLGPPARPLHLETLPCRTIRVPASAQLWRQRVNPTVCQASQGGEPKENAEPQKAAEDIMPSASDTPQAEWGGEAQALTSWEIKETPGNWKGLAAVAALVVLCAVGARIVFLGIIGSINRRAALEVGPPTATAKVQQEEKGSEKGMGMEPEDLWGSKDTSEEWSSGRPSATAAAFEDGVAPVISSARSSAWREDQGETASWDKEGHYGDSDGAEQGVSESEREETFGTEYYSWPEDKVTPGPKATEAGIDGKDTSSGKPQDTDEGSLPQTETASVDKPKESESGTSAASSKSQTADPSEDEESSALAVAPATGQPEAETSGLGEDQPGTNAKEKTENSEVDAALASATASATATRIELDKDRAQKELKAIMETKFDEQERTVPLLPDMSTAVEMPASAVDPLTLKLLEGNTLQASAQRSAVALSAATAASEASNRAAAYAAAASSASSKAAEAAHWASVAARAAHSGMETASEEAILAAECRVEAASRAAKAAEEKAATAAGMASAYQDIASTQKDVAEQAAKVESTKEDRELPRERWLASQLDWMQMSPAWAKAMAFTEPLRDFFSALWSQIVALWQTVIGSIQKLFQAIVSMFSKGG